jgi:hypothetical protein
MALLMGCNEPSQLSVDGETDTPTSSIPSDAVAIEIEVDDPNQSDTLTAAAGIAPGKAKSGDTVTFAVRARTAESWHIYAFDHTGVGSPTKIELELPADMEALGQWLAPDARLYPSTPPGSVFEGDMMFQQRLKIADGAAPGPREVKCKFAYQTCNDAFCNPPTSMELTAIVEIE